VHTLDLIKMGLSALYGFTVRPDLDIMQHLYSLFALAKLLDC